MVYKDPQYADGLIMAYTEENKMIDTFDPTTNRSEYAMMTFCNNHDNWRMQSMTGKAEMRMCLAVITFWQRTEWFSLPLTFLCRFVPCLRPGIPLHYAGDEQDFDTPGSALDGWAREVGSVREGQFTSNRKYRKDGGGYLQSESVCRI